MFIPGLSRPCDPRAESFFGFMSLPELLIQLPELVVGGYIAGIILRDCLEFLYSVIILTELDIFEGEGISGKRVRCVLFKKAFQNFDTGHRYLWDEKFRREFRRHRQAVDLNGRSGTSRRRPTHDDFGRPVALPTPARSLCGGIPPSCVRATTRRAAKRRSHP